REGREEGREEGRREGGRVEGRVGGRRCPLQAEDDLVLEVGEEVGALLLTRREFGGGALNVGADLSEVEALHQDHIRVDQRHRREEVCEGEGEGERDDDGEGGGEGEVG